MATPLVVAATEEKTTKKRARKRNAVVMTEAAVARLHVEATATGLNSFSCCILICVVHDCLSMLILTRWTCGAITR
jgi:hypothetical protein